jgi:hypothetical protein
MLARLRSHDRGVVIGLSLSIFPLFPISLVGFLVTLYNYYLIKINKLSKNEAAIVRKTLFLGIATVPLGIISAYIAISKFSQLVGPNELPIIFLFPSILIESLKAAIEYLRELLMQDSGSNRFVIK